MKVMFVYPGFENIGIEYLSAMLLDCGVETRLAFDPQLFRDPFFKCGFLSGLFNSERILLKQIEDFQPQLIAFSVVSANYLWALDLAKKIKASLPVHITMGGIHPSSVPDKVILQECVDSVIVGEGEYAFLELVQSLASGKIDYSIPNVWLKKEKQIISNPVRPLIADLDSLPFPDKELYYREIPGYHHGYTLITRRGCLNRCSYCHHSVLDRVYSKEPKRIRLRSVDNVMEELRAAKQKYRFKLLRINDDLFTYHTPWLREFVACYRKEINVPFYCFGSPSTIDEETISLLKQGGCYQLCMGVQSVNPDVRQRIFQRMTTNEQIIKAIEVCRSYRLRIVVDNIIGYPGETTGDLIEMAEFYGQHRPDRICIFWLKYYPGTSIVDIAEKQDVLNAQKIRELEECPCENANTLVDPGLAKEKKRFHLLFVLYHFLSLRIFRWCVRHRLYRFLPMINPACIEYPYMMFSRERLDIPRRRYYRKYFYYLPKTFYANIKKRFTIR
ncbi:MAG: radical SAM protein [Candidatus Omnitrophica bacterium]|nr:radical SAM protein [Candidatus Omnitrophota bacterium]